MKKYANFSTTQNINNTKKHKSWLISRNSTIDYHILLHRLLSEARIICNHRQNSIKQTEFGYLKRTNVADVVRGKTIKTDKPPR
ncbi:hypothetical protein GBA52_011419 [Prunus armeniaca]|nr:hypothetical protein GBA52_011419 [Prunus armeniaca]